MAADIMEEAGTGGGGGHGHRRGGTAVISFTVGRASWRALLLRPELATMATTTMMTTMTWPSTRRCRRLLAQSRYRSFDPGSGTFLSNNGTVSCALTSDKG